MVDYVEEKTEFEFGECGEVKLRNELQMETCLNNETSLRFRSDYDMGDVKLGIQLEVLTQPPVVCCCVRFVSRQLINLPEHPLPAARYYPAVPAGRWVAGEYRRFDSAVDYRQCLPEKKAPELYSLLSAN